MLVASASVPGVFPPVLIRVSDGHHDYDEMHVDGGVTTSVFTLPLIAGIQSYELPQLRGAHLYVIVNGQLARTPQTTPFNTVDILSNSFAAEMTYKTRGAIVENIAAAKRLGMSFRMTEIPADYLQESFIDFDQRHMQALFDYAFDCASRGLVWLTPEQSIKRNMSPRRAAASTMATIDACPVQAATGAH